MNSSAYIPLTALTITQTEPLNFDPGKERGILEQKIIVSGGQILLSGNQEACVKIPGDGGELRVREKTCLRESGTESEDEEAVNS